MTTILYRIPDKHFPGWKIKQPFHAKVQYDFKDNNVSIFDVAFSALCLQYISDTNGLIFQMKKDIAEVERGRMNNAHVDQTVLGSIAHFIRP